MAKFLAEKAKETGLDQQLGPLNPYERRIVHMAVAEVPGVDDRERRRRVLEDRASSRRGSRRLEAGVGAAASPEPRVLMFLHRRHHRRHRDAAGPRRHRRRAPQRAGRARDRAAARSRTTAPLAAAARDVHHDPADAGRPATAATRSIRPSSPTFPRPHSYTGDDVVEMSAHGSPVVLRAIVARGDRGRRAARRARRVHAARVSQRPDRSDAGRSGRRSHRRGDAAAGARGVRSARRHADARDRRRSTRRCSI